MNLVSNSIKYTKQGKICICIDQDMQNDNILLVSVYDTGAGIPIDIQKKLFRQYATFDRGYNKMGTGLGLMICKRLAGKLGPREWIFLQSEVNVGSCFAFLIYKEIKLHQQQGSTIHQFEDEEYFSSKQMIGFNKTKQFSVLSSNIYQQRFQNLYKNQENDKKQNIGFTFQSRPQPIRIQEPKESCKKQINDSKGNQIDRSKSKFSFQNVDQSQGYISSEDSSKQIRDSYDNCKRNPSQFIQLNSIDNYDNQNILQKSTTTHVKYSPDQTQSHQLRSLSKVMSQNNITNYEDISPGPMFILSNDNQILIKELKSVFKGRKRTILLVDDTEFNLIPLRNFFAKIDNVHVYETDTGDDALRMVKKGDIQFDIIFMDVYMPGMNGFDAADEIKNHIKQNALPHICELVVIQIKHRNIYLNTKLYFHIYIIMQTTGDNDLKRFSMSQAENIVEKPIKLKKLIYVLKQSEQNIDIKSNILSTSKKNYRYLSESQKKIIKKLSLMSLNPDDCGIEKEVMLQQSIGGNIQL